MPFALLLLLVGALLLSPSLSAQTLDHIGTVEFETTGFLDDDEYRVGGSDVWGYTAPGGTEYAIMGVLDGFAVVKIPDMEIVAHIPGPEDDDPYYHRDVVVHGQMAYTVAENLGRNEGLQIIDLSGLPESVELVNVFTEGVVSSHNLDVDAETGLLYILNSEGNAIQIVDVSDPLDPETLGFIAVLDSHDIHAKDGRLFISEGREPSFSIWDVSDASAPEMLTRVTIPAGGYSHNIWPTDDGNYVLTTEETADRTVKVWDITDPDNVELVGEYLGENRLAHNVHIQGRYAFLSHYTSGITVIDLEDPTNPVEVASYDTTPGDDEAAFRGTWGATVPSPAGYVYGSDLDARLTVLRFNATDS